MVSDLEGLTPCRFPSRRAGSPRWCGLSARCRAARPPSSAPSPARAMRRSGPAFAPAPRRRASSTFPPEAPIIRFLDTRGLGEAAYDPAADIAYCEDRAHLILAVVKALDAEQSAVVDAVRAARERHPDWPVVVAQTTLHEGYAPGAGPCAALPLRGRRRQPGRCPSPWRGRSRTSGPCSRACRAGARCASCPSTSRSPATASSLPTTAARP